MLPHLPEADPRIRLGAERRAGRSSDEVTFLREEVRRLRELVQLASELNAELNLGSVLERVVEGAAELLGAQGGSVSLIDQRTGHARIQAVHQMPGQIIGQELGPHDGITGEVLAKRAPVVVRAYNRELPGPLPGLDFLHAATAVPVWWRGQMVGVFAVFSADAERVFDDYDLELMELLATHVAIAIENARLYGEARTRIEEMVSVQRLAAVVLEERDFDRVLQTVCEQLQHLTDASGVGLALLEDNAHFLEMRTVVGPSAEALLGERIPIAHSLAGEALRTNQPQRSDDALNDPRGYHHSLVLGGTRTILSVPMKTRQRDVGALSIYNKRGGIPFTDRDAELATLFANQAAVAIESARLYEETREYAVLEERNRLARELHDSVTQSLFSVTLLSQAALSLWDRDPPKARERVERANELAQGALAEMRALIFQLRPMALQEEGLLAALKKHAMALRSRESLDVAVEVEGLDRRLPAPVEEAAFRIVQESLNNIVKHAKASQVRVRLTFAPRALRVCTIDNGVGFNAQARPKARSMGMASMRERVEAVGGHIEVHSAPGAGTSVCVELPTPEVAEGREHDGGENGT